MRNNVLPYKSAICYSGFRDGQGPDNGIFPSYEEIKEDLLILQPHWQSLRLYDCDVHAETVLEVIKNEGLNFDVMLGAYIIAEVSNPECPWGGEYSPTELAINRKLNEKRIQKLIGLANAYPNIISSVSAGNEATVSWTDHMVSIASLMGYVEHLKASVQQPVTFCENYVPWLDKLKPVGEALDFISIHTYPVWEYKSIDEALEYTKQNYRAVADAYPGKQIVITEAGWTTKSNGRGIEPHQVNEETQRKYISQLLEWIKSEGILTYVFEAFDENWKGSSHPLEPEKHWGLFYADRTPKPVMAEYSTSVLGDLKKAN
jgi:exo-beta-1,3-glucanase (GH17 family)